MHEAHPDRIAIIGNSMGSVSAGAIFTENPNLKCLVGFNGTFAWEEGIRIGDLVPSTKDNKNQIKEYDPMNNGDKFNERAILILHSVGDTSVSIESQRAFYSKMTNAYYRNSDKIQFLEATKVNHHITTGMLEKAIIWLKENL